MLRGALWLPRAQQHQSPFPAPFQASGNSVPQGPLGSPLQGRPLTHRLGGKVLALGGDAHWRGLSGRTPQTTCAAQRVWWLLSTHSWPDSLLGEAPDLTRRVGPGLCLKGMESRTANPPRGDVTNSNEEHASLCSSQAQATVASGRSSPSLKAVSLGGLRWDRNHRLTPVPLGLPVPGCRLGNVSKP